MTHNKDKGTSVGFSFKILIVKSKKHGSKEVLVSESDFDRVNNIKWSLSKTESGKFYVYSPKNKLPLHRFILFGFEPTESLVDHKDHNPLNNQRDNLRACNSEQNSHNTSSRTGSTSKYLGVSVHTTKIKGVLNDGTTKIYTSTRYLAQIQYKKSKIKIGRFKTENEAAIAYNEAATKYFGEFANLNVIDDTNNNSFIGRKKLPFRVVTPKMLIAENYVG